MFIEISNDLLKTLNELKDCDYVYHCPECGFKTYVERSKEFQCWNIDCGAAQEFCPKPIPNESPALYFARREGMMEQKRNELRTALYEYRHTIIKG